MPCVLEQHRQHASAFALRDRVLGVIDDDDLLHLVFLDPRIDDGLELLVAGERVAERPLAHRREAGLGRAVGVDDGLEARVELRRDGLELAAEAGAGDRQHLVAIDQAAHRLERLGFQRLRVVADQLDRQAADAALGVDLFDGDLHRGLGGLAPFGALAGERREAADLDAAAGELCGLGDAAAAPRATTAAAQCDQQSYEDLSLALPSQAVALIARFPAFARIARAARILALESVLASRRRKMIPRVMLRFMRRSAPDRCAAPPAC